MLHYNFPQFSVGETGRYGSPGRREIGHGALGERCLKQVMPSEEEFKLLNDMAMLNADGQELVINFIHSLLQNPKYREEEVNT